MRPSFLDNMSQQMAMVYEEVTDRILVNMARHFPYIHDSAEVMGSFEYQTRMLAQMGQVNRENVDIIAQSLGGADAALRQALETAIMEALKNEEPKLKNAASLGMLMGGDAIPAEVTPNQMQAFSSFYRQSSDKLNLVNTVMLESTQAAYTATVSDVVNRINRTQGILNTAAGDVVTGVETWNQAVRNAVKKTIDNGLTGFIDHAGHHWSPEAYVAMDVRTTMLNTARAAVWEREEQYGCDTYQVSSHNGARPLCYPWQGKVISRTDTARDIEDLDGNKIHVYAQSETSYGEPAGLFGINCMHYPMTFIPGFSTLKGEPQEPEENAKTYEESQQQRALERKLREERRDLAVMKAQGAPEAEIKAQRERVKKASQDIDDFCDETGRTRRRNREGTPINAKFPPKGSYDPSAFPHDDRDRINDWFKNGGTDNPPPSPTNIHLGPNNIPPQGRGQNVVQQATQQPEKPVTIQDAKDKESLFKAVENDLGIKVTDGVKGLEFAPVKDAFIGVKRLCDDFPEVVQGLSTAELNKAGIMSCTGEKITFNKEWFSTASKLPDTCKKNAQSGWWPKNTVVSSIGTHEAAHGIEWFLDCNNPSYSYKWEQVDAWNRCTEAKAIVSQACKNVKKTPFGKGKKNDELIGSVSRYAKSNASETLAESFADYYTNGDSASELSKEVVRLTTERYKQYGGKGNGR